MPKTLGERPHIFKLNEPGFFEPEFDTEDGKVMREGAERMIEKLEILSAVTAKNRKFKKQCEERLDRLEKIQTTKVDRDTVHEDMLRLENRLLTSMRET